MDDRWLQVLGLVLIIEALLPFISPRSYRQAVQQIANTPVGGGCGIGDAVAPLISAHDFSSGEWIARLAFLCLSSRGITCQFCFRVNPSFRKLYVT